MTTPTRDQAADVFYGIPVLDFEDHEAAGTHDQRRAIAALNAFHRAYSGERLTDLGVDPARDMLPGWARFEDRPDGTWTVECPEDHPAAFPVTWLHL